LYGGLDGIVRGPAAGRSPETKWIYSFVVASDGMTAMEKKRPAPIEPARGQLGASSELARSRDGDACIDLRGRS
jgi:hypothetical protein